MTSCAVICRKEAALRQREVMGMYPSARLVNLGHCCYIANTEWDKLRLLFRPLNHRNSDALTFDSEV